MSSATDSIVALTSGEPSGVGLELAYRAWLELNQSQPFFIIADRRHLAERIGADHCIEIQQVKDCVSALNHGLPFLHLQFAGNAPAGQVQHENSKGVIDSIRWAVGLALNKEVAAVCTNPINKNVFKHCGENQYPGHTEFLAELCHVPLTVMLLAGKDLKVVPVSGHQALIDVPQAITRSRLYSVISLSLNSLKRDFKISHPVIYVAGLNPHAGEDGLFGEEEQHIIRPVIKMLQAEGIDINGPYSADTMFHEDVRKRYHLAICMYHDQALIPLKTLHFFNAVNVTLGLPIIRTSPDHGTALDIAGKSLARPDSLIEAIRLAGAHAKNRQSLV